MPAKAGMKWASALSMRNETASALDELFESVSAQLGGAPPDAAFIFVSPHHKDRYAAIHAAIRHELRPAHLLGCSGGGIIGAAREAEHAPAISLTAAVLPDVDIRTFHLEDDNLPDMDAAPRPWEDLVGVRAASKPSFIVLADPFSMGRADDLLNGLDFAFPGAVKIGGLASGANTPGQNALFVDDSLKTSGAVGMALSGPISVDALVAQGCRPIGKPMQITRCMRNLLIELDKQPAMSAVAELLEGATESERELIQSSLFLGIVMNRMNTDPKPGDFLIRNLIGYDAQHGVLAIGALLNEGQTVQFHLREANSAREDIREVLRRYNTERMDASRGEALPEQPRGALLFSCLGRGKALYGEPDHDSAAFASELGTVPLGGFFCNGEIGPVNGTTYIHGFTSCFAVFGSGEPKLATAAPDALSGP